MDLDTITMEPDVATELAEDYRKLGHPGPEDRAILAGLLALAAGKQVINLRDVLRAGGENEDGTPRLAVGWADWQWCHVARGLGGGVTFAVERIGWTPGNARRFSYGALLPPRSNDTLSWDVQRGVLRAMVPPIPPKHRPAPSGLRRFAILWEVDRWEVAPRPPGDPALLRPLHGDLYTVEAMWDLTPLEQAVLAGRNAS